ncbi:hypothetical protein S7335_547 [Synechococcus sp. PCC 7335]|uniref:hypothetical protein n=1 Tax=Synechococcus sp. (strain ATCC 29403 / PCC 7335) TaxID=91464 RepID=UPI00017EB902|nr:hypothetical protein [Synechococcus sp. PCC 7335]EDX83367.1 hypothetical protein S7335_547 [Synechococcus sp. PCC 7335]
MTTKKLLAQALHTGDISIMSNVTSITATGDKVARIEGSVRDGVQSPAAVHVDFDVKQPSHLKAVLEETRSLGLILQPDDAVELGVLLTALGMKNKESQAVAAITEHLSALLAER